MVDLTLDSTIDGAVHVFGRNRSIFTRIFWICIFIFSFLVLFHYIHEAYKKWIIEPDIINKHRLRNHEEFPQFALTVCHDAIDDKLFNLKGFKEKYDNKEHLTISREECSINDAFQSWCSKEFSRYRVKFLGEQASKAWEEQCSKIDRRSNFSEILALIFRNSYELQAQSGIEGVTSRNVLTSFGPCTTFSTHKASFFKEKTMNDAYYSTASYEVPFNFSLDSYIYIEAPKQNIYHCNDSYKVIVHHPNETPTIYHKYDYIDISKKTKLFVKITKSKIFKDHLRIIDPNIRKCYFENEGNLKYFKFYSKYYCMLECHAEICNCSTIEVPSTDENKKFCDFFTLQNYEELDDLLKEYYDLCVENYTQKFEECKKKCLPQCNKLEYTTRMEVIDHYWISGEFSIGHESEYFIEETEYFLAYTFENFIAETGGYLGLFLGCSILSIIEVLLLVISKFLKVLLRLINPDQVEAPSSELEQTVNLLINKMIQDDDDVWIGTDIERTQKIIEDLKSRSEEMQKKIKDIQCVCNEASKERSGKSSEENQSELIVEEIE